MNRIAIAITATELHASSIQGRIVVDLFEVLSDGNDPYGLSWELVLHAENLRLQVNETGLFEYVFAVKSRDTTHVYVSNTADGMLRFHIQDFLREAIFNDE
jgi:hypothetical protein